MIYLREHLFLHDKGLNFLYKLGNLHRNEVLPWWFHLSPHIMVATMIATLSVQSQPSHAQD